MWTMRAAKLAVLCHRCAERLVDIACCYPCKLGAATNNVSKESSPLPGKGSAAGHFGLFASGLLLSVVCSTHFVVSAMQSNAEQQPQEAFQEGKEEKQQQTAAGSTPDQQLSLSDQIVSPLALQGYAAYKIASSQGHLSAGAHAKHTLPAAAVLFMLIEHMAALSCVLRVLHQSSWGLLNVPTSATGAAHRRDSMACARARFMPFCANAASYSGQVTCSCAHVPVPDSIIWHQLSRAWLCAGQDSGAGAAAGGGSKQRCWYL